MSEATEYTGGCHCGKVRYRVKTELGQVIACNCSICSKKAHLLSFTPAANFELLSGDDVLTEYRFNSGQIKHLFCNVCGIQSFARGAMPDGTPMVAINARCLDEVDPKSLDVHEVDGKSL